jgi:cysteine sulfinate desulfinase/cysteine desulfurase-like protein
MAVYLDNNATTPLDESVVQAIETASREFWGNPSSSYETGRKAKQAVDRARAQIGHMIGAPHPEREITFTSGGTEAMRSN